MVIAMKKGKLLILTLLLTAGQTRAQEIFTEETPPAAVQLHTNIVYDALACPNIGVEIQTDLGLAWQLDYTGAWWNNDGRHRYFSNYFFMTEMRYYLAKPVMEMPYYGHHIGMYGQMATFDFEFGGKGYMSRDLDFSFAVGLSYGYSKRLSRRWNIDCTVGFGFIHAQYDSYVPQEDGEGYRRTETRRLNFFGPTKVEAKLVYNINYSNNK